MKYLSLFSGIGGFELGIQQAYETANNNLGRVTETSDSENRWDKSNTNRGNGERWRTNSCIGYSEINKYAIQIYEKRFPTHHNFGDITKIIAKELPDFDLIVGGFPCQSFSIAGKRLGFKDTRGTLFFDIARIIKEKRPKYLLLENVKGLLSSHTVLTFDGILDTLSKELSIKENICLKQFQPIQEWEIESDNLSVYLQSIGGTSGLEKNFQSLQEKTLPIIKRLNFYPKELTTLLELKEEEWVSNLLRLSSIEHFNLMDIPLLEKMVVMNERIVSLWKEKLEENSNQQKLSITSMETNLMTELETCISAIQELNIILFTIKQWKLSTNLWNKIKSPSKKVNTYYVKTFNIIINTLTELGYDIQWQVLNSKNFGVPQNRERVFIIGHLRGTSRPEVFPFGENNSENIILPTITTRITADSTGTYVCKKQTQKIDQLNNPTHSNNRVYSEKGLSPTLNTAQGGNRQPFIKTVGLLKENEKPKGNCLPRERVLDGTKGARAVTTSQNQMPYYTDEMQIRRLTPTECERLQGFPDNFTKYGIDEKGEQIEISDTQRYKTLGNAVTVNVIKEIMKQLL